MKSFSLALSAWLLTASSVHAEQKKSFTPIRIHYEDLISSKGTSLLDALEDSSGMVSVTNLPENFSAVKQDVLSHLHECILANQEHQDQATGDEITVVAQEPFPDGTLRRSLATATTANEGPLGLKLHTPSAPACRAFEDKLGRFRSITREATTAFAKALSDELEPHLQKPLLKQKGGDGETVYDTIADLVANGEQLEHFHSYQKTEKDLVGEEYYDEESRMATIDIHADQGFFIAFTPGMMISNENNHKKASEGFYIVEDDDSNDTPVHVDFDLDSDDLVFMLGDGVNQYINNQYIDGENGGRRHLRATPHAVSLKVHDDSQARVWYGRMVLPPNNALVASPEGTVQTTLTYGDVRRRLVETTDDAHVPAGLGCSSPTMRALQHNNVHEAASSCEQGTLFCWARCMALADYEFTEETCQEQNLGLKCINPRGQFQTGERHGDFWPACSNTTLELTPYPEIPQREADADYSVEWMKFLEANGTVYDHSFDLTNEKNNGVMLQWSVVDEEQGIVKGRLAFNDVFGWLSVGFSDPEGKHNGMNGADILLALPGGNYTPMYGLQVPGKTLPGTDEISVEISKKKRDVDFLDTEINPEGTSVHEYMIDPKGSSFRHWSEPTGTAQSDNFAVELTDFASALTFETNNINGKTFNMSGFDDLVWAGNSKDYHVGYHGRGNRARFYVNWVTGEGYLWVKPEEEEEGGHGGGHGDQQHGGHDEEHDMKDHEEDSAASGLSKIFSATVAGIVAVWFL